MVQFTGGATTGEFNLHTLITAARKFVLFGQSPLYYTAQRGSSRQLALGIRWRAGCRAPGPVPHEQPATTGSGNSTALITRLTVGVPATVGSQAIAPRLAARSGRLTGLPACLGRPTAAA